MVTLTLHTTDAVALLKLVRRTLREENDPDAVSWRRSDAVLRCALLLCDCEELGAESSR